MSRLMLAAFSAALFVCLLGMDSLASSARPKKTLGQLISECMQEVEKGRTAGRKLSPQQRMVAEAQCRARAEAEMARG